MSAATASRYGLPVDTGAYVGRRHPDSARPPPGIVPGDIITAFDGQAVESASDLIKAGRGTKNPGDTVTLTVNSGGQEKEVQVTLGDDSASQKAKQEAAEPEQSMNATAWKTSSPPAPNGAVRGRAQATALTPQLDPNLGPFGGAILMANNPVTPWEI